MRAKTKQTFEEDTMSLKNKTAALVLAALMLLPTAVSASTADFTDFAVTLADLPTVMEGEITDRIVTLGADETEFTFNAAKYYLRDKRLDFLLREFALFASLYKTEADGSESTVVRFLRIDDSVITFKNLIPGATYRLAFSCIMPKEEDRMTLRINRQGDENYDTYLDSVLKIRQNAVLDRVFGKHTFDESDERPITRAEAARLLYILYTGDNANLPVLNGYPMGYGDLTSENEPAYSYIQFLTALGLFRGNAQGRVRPYDYLTENEAWTLFVRFAGKEQAAQAGGYPLGYLSLAGDLGLLARDSYTLDGRSHITLSDFAYAVKNLSDVRMDYPVAYDAQTGLLTYADRSPKTFYERRMLNAVEMLTDCEYYDT